jgi:hypothetical protein
VIKETITVGTSKNTMTTNVESMKYRVIQLDGSGLDITLHELKFVPELWVSLFSIKKP